MTVTFVGHKSVYELTKNLCWVPFVSICENNHYVIRRFDCRMLQFGAVHLYLVQYNAYHEIDIVKHYKT